MADRAQLIAQKNEVRRKIERARRQLEAESAKGEAASRRRISKLEGELDRLMASEASLRLAIDQSR